MASQTVRLIKQWVVWHPSLRSQFLAFANFLGKTALLSCVLLPLLKAQSITLAPKCSEVFNSESDLLKSFNRLQKFQSEGRPLAYFSHILTPNEKTFVLLPGINRGYLATDPFIHALSTRRANFVIIHFSNHIHSQALFGPFNEGATNLNQLGKEVLDLMTHLKITDPQYVSLSFSSAVSLSNSLPSRHPSIEFAPIGDGAEGQFLNSKFIEKSLSWNPFWNQVYQQQKTLGLNHFWSNSLLPYQKDLPNLQNPLVFQTAIRSYTNMSLAVDQFNISEAPHLATQKRIFMLATAESPTRLKSQINGIRQYHRSRNEWPLIFLFENTGHNITAEKPTEAASILAQSDNVNHQGIIVVSKTGKLTPLTIHSSDELLKNIAK